METLVPEGLALILLKRQLGRRSEEGRARVASRAASGHSRRGSANPGGGRPGHCGGLGLNTPSAGVAPALEPTEQASRAIPGDPEGRAPHRGPSGMPAPPKASTPTAGEDVQGERPAQQPGPVQTGCALLPRLLHRRDKGGALLLQPGLRPCLRELVLGVRKAPAPGTGESPAPVVDITVTRRRIRR